MALDGVEDAGIDLVEPSSQRAEEGDDLLDGYLIEVSLADGEEDRDFVADAQRIEAGLFERLAQAAASCETLACLRFQLGPEPREGFQLVQLGVKQAQVAGKLAEHLGLGLAADP